MKFLYDHKSLAANDFKKIEAGYQAAQQSYDMARQGTRAQDKEPRAGSTAPRSARCAKRRNGWRTRDCWRPISGFVGMRRIDVGDTVGAGTPVIGVLDLNPVKVRIGVPESEIGKVHEGARAIVAIPSLENRQFEGKVEAVGVSADPASRSYTVKVVVPNPEHVLRAGLVSQARIFGSTMVNVLTVPGDAILRDAKGVVHVYVYNPGQNRVYLRRVEVGEPAGGEVEIRNGLNADEQVVVAGQQNVREGSPAKVMGAEK